MTFLTTLYVIANLIILYLLFENLQRKKEVRALLYLVEKIIDKMKELHE